MIEVPFFNLLFSLGMSVRGLALMLLRSKMISEGFSSPFCFIRSSRSLSVFTNSTLTFILRAVSWILARKNKSSTKAKMREFESARAGSGSGSGGR